MAGTRSESEEMPRSLKGIGGAEDKSYGGGPKVDGSFELRKIHGLALPREGGAGGDWTKKCGGTSFKRKGKDKNPESAHKPGNYRGIDISQVFP